MALRRLAVGLVMFLGSCPHGTAADYTIHNPADRIRNPADKMHNPATEINNPAANIYSPASRLDNPNPLSPPTQPVPQPPPAVPKAVEQKKKSLPAIPQKKYYFKKVKEYIAAAKKAFVQDDYLEFLAITEDALRRITAGTLNSSIKTRQKLEKYKVFGYGLLEKDEE